MPEVHEPVGKRDLSPAQEKALANMWYQMQTESGFQRYTRLYDLYMRNLTPGERALWQKQLDDEYAKDPQGYWNKVAGEESLGQQYDRGGRARVGGDAFPPVTPEQVSPDGKLLHPEVAPGGGPEYTPKSGLDPEAPNPPGWSDQSGAGTHMAAQFDPSWVRQPENVQLVSLMAAFAGHLMGSDPTANMDGGVGRLDKNAPAQGMPDQGPDGNVPWGRLGPDGLPMTELQQYEADERQAWNDSLMKSPDDPDNRRAWQDDNHISQTYQQGMLRVPAAEYNFNPATGKIQRDREGEPVVSYGGADALAPGAPRETGDSNSKTAVSYEQRNSQIRGARGAALME